MHTPPPQSITIEKAILQTLLMDEASFKNNIDELEPDHFYDLKLKKIAQWVYDNYSNDMVLLSDIYPEAMAELYSEEVAGSSDLKTYYKIIRDLFYRRETIKACQRLSNTLSDREVPFAEAIQEFEKVSIPGTFQKNEKGAVKICDLILPALERFHQKLSRTDTTAIKFGIDAIDSMLGGLDPGEYCIIAARPGMGKTSLALNIAKHNAIRKNIPVLLFSLEMSDGAITDRVITSNANVNLDSIKRGILPKKDFPRIAQTVQQVADAPLYIIDTPGMHISRIEKLVNKYVDLYGIKLLIFDHVKFIKTDPMGNMHREMSDISNRLRTLFKSTNVPGIVLSQLNRSLESRSDPTPKLSDLRESGSFEEDAHKIVFVHRVRTSDPEKTYLIIGKNRDGKDGMIEVLYDKSIMTFKDIDTNHTEQGGW